MGNLGNILFVLYLVVAIASSNVIPKVNIKNIPFSADFAGSEYLDSQQKYLLSWNVSSNKESISFEVIAETKGYVGFGISPYGTMKDADLLIAGMNGDGSLYSHDLHSTENGPPAEDIVNNWNVTSGEETATHTKLHFNRLLNTCDDEDFRITDSTMRVIWSLGQTDDIAYHGPTQRGTKSVNFFSQAESDFDSAKYEQIDITVETLMPAQHTAYWCTIHQLPLFQEKQHIVAFEPFLDNEAALQHTHHFIIHRCIAPVGQDPDELFPPWISHQGDHCHDPMNTSFPFKYCAGNAVYMWGKGGKRMVLPENVGLPMPEFPGQSEYYALEVHYDNPALIENVQFRTGARIFYTSELREVETGLLLIEQKNSIQLTVPPQSENFIVSGHCSPECTEGWLPSNGVTIFNNLFHTHQTGRKMKLRHFRGNQELPPIDQDEYYDFDFQQNKALSHAGKLLRGDQLTLECSYDSMHVDGKKAVIGGLSAHEEMCQAWIYYYPRLDWVNCGSGSEETLEEHFELLGVTKWQTVGSGYPGGLKQYIILEPDNLSGYYLDSVSYKVNWTAEFRERFQQEKRFGEQYYFCYSGDGNGGLGYVGYPDNLTAYVPPNECDEVTPSTPRTTTPEDCEDCMEFEDWMKHNVGLIKDQLKQLQDSVDRLAGNQTVGA